MMNEPTKNILNQIRQDIENNDLNQAILRLKSLLANSPKLDEAILQAARWQDIC